MRSRLVLTAVLLCVSVAAQSVSRDPLLNRLAKTDLFCFGGFGLASSIYEGEQNYRQILSRPTAETDFERLFEIGNAPAKCYALVGLRQLNKPRFEQLAASLQPPKLSVPIAEGCLQFNRPMSEIILSIRAGVYSGSMATGLTPPPPWMHKESWGDLIARLFSK